MERIKISFAQDGDKTSIPDAITLDGSVNNTQGFTSRYSENPAPVEEGGSPTAKVIERTDMNYILWRGDINQKLWQEQTFPDWINDDGDGIPFAYPKNAIVRYTDGENYVSLENNNSTVPTNITKWINLNSSMKNNITVNVGLGQTHTTINQALEYLSAFYPLYIKSGITATINLKAGFVMAEQILVSGIDLGWITIVGEDAETIITHTSLTTSFNSINNYPAFGIDKGGVSPIIGQLFRFNVQKVGGNKHGLMVVGAGSSANVLSGKGFIGAGTYGIYASGASTIDAYGANASNAGNSGIRAGGASAINAQSANASNAGTYGIIATGVSVIDAQGAIIQNQTTGTARVCVAFGSQIIASALNTTGGTVTVLNQTANTLTSSGIIYQ